MRNLLIIIGLTASCCYAEDIIPAGTPIMAKVLNTVHIDEKSRSPITFLVESGFLKNCVGVGYGGQVVDRTQISVEKYICGYAVFEAYSYVTGFKNKIVTLMESGTEVKIVNFKPLKCLNCKVED